MICTVFSCTRCLIMALWWFCQLEPPKSEATLHQHCGDLLVSAAKPHKEPAGNSWTCQQDVRRSLLCNLKQRQGQFLFPGGQLDVAVLCGHSLTPRAADVPRCLAGYEEGMGGLKPSNIHVSLGRGSGAEGAWARHEVSFGCPY